MCNKSMVCVQILQWDMLPLVLIFTWRYTVQCREQFINLIVYFVYVIVALDAVDSTLANMNSSVINLQGNANSLNATLQGISDSVASLRNNCTAAAPLLSSTCNQLDPTVFQNGLGADYNQVWSVCLFCT